MDVGNRVMVCMNATDLGTITNSNLISLVQLRLDT